MKTSFLYSPLYEECLPLPCTEGVPIFSRKSHEEESYRYSGELEEWEADWVEKEDEIWFLQTSENRYEFGVIDVEDGWEDPTYRVKSISSDPKVPGYEELVYRHEITVEKPEEGVYKVSGEDLASIKFTFEDSWYFEWVF